MAIQIRVCLGFGTVRECHARDIGAACRGEQARGGGVDHRIPTRLFNGKQHRMIGPEAASELDAADHGQEQDRQNDGGFDRCRTFLFAPPRWSALSHWMRSSVLAVNDVGIPGQGKIGV